MSHCESVSLDLYRTKQEKIELLKMSLDSMDHDVIVTVIKITHLYEKYLDNIIFETDFNKSNFSGNIINTINSCQSLCKIFKRMC